MSGHQIATAGNRTQLSSASEPTSELHPAPTALGAPGLRQRRGVDTTARFPPVRQGNPYTCGGSVALVAVQPAKSAETIEPRGRHPLARSVAAVERAVTSLSIEMLDVSDSPWPPAPWIACDHALSDPTFFSRWRMMVTKRLARQYASSSDPVCVPDRTTGAYVLRWYLVIPSYVGALLSLRTAGALAGAATARFPARRRGRWEHRAAPRAVLVSR